MKHSQAGLTLIELLIIIAVIGTLAAVAVPAYRDYTIRDHVWEAILATSQCRMSIAELYRASPKGTVIGANKWGCAERLTATRYLESMSLDADGVITVTTSVSTSLGAAASRNFALTPTREDGTALAIRDIPATVFSFKCAPSGPTPISEEHLPRLCR